ncbi:MAG: mechanosensitive ion channel family protein [Ignavibacteriaceae bacterium]|nr:mechanosensitive ion channel family protein [Ignavibacteriaceae bacterium]
MIYLNIFGKSEIVPLIIFSTLLITSLFALVPFFKNILGRFLISSSNLFNEGDFIQISGYQGNVVAIRWFTTEITNELGYTVYLPNSIYLNNPLENVNLGKKEEVVSLEFELPLDIKPEIAKEIIKDAALSNFLLYIHKEPEIFIKSVSYTENIYRLKLNITLFDSKYESLLIDQLNKTVMDFLITNRKQEN